MAADNRIYKKFPAGVKRQDSSLTTPEINFLELYLFTDQFAHDIYKTFFKTSDMSDAQVRKAAANLIQSNDAQVYIEDRNTQIDNFLSNTIIEAEESELLDENGNFSPKVLRQVKIITAKEVMKKGSIDTKVFERVLDFLMKNTKVSQDGQIPQRVLAEQCRTCRYRIHIENNYDDVCKICRYQSESQVKYDHKNQLIIPKQEK